LIDAYPSGYMSNDDRLGEKAEEIMKRMDDQK